MIISFSGIDSSGKTTQIELLYKYCKTRKWNIIRKWSKARGTPGIIFIKSLIRKESDASLKESIEFRKEIYKNIYKQKLLYILSMIDLCLYWGIYFRISSLFCKVFICDRYLWDTYVDIKCDFFHIDIDNSILWNLVIFFAPKPNTSFVFIIPAELSLARDNQKAADGIDNLDVKVFKTNLYMKLVQECKWTHVMDGTESIEILHNKVKAAINR